VTETRSQLVLDTSELGRGAGIMRELHKTVAAPADLQVPLIGVPEGAPLDLDIRLETVEDGILAMVEVSGETKGECGRCLDAFTQPLDITFQELYVYPEAVEQSEEDDESADVQYEIEDDLLDLEPALRDAIGLSLPFQPVCSADCPGLCSVCGVRLVDNPDHYHEDLDPRWSALEALLHEKKEEG